MVFALNKLILHIVACKEKRNDNGKEIKHENELGNDITKSHAKKWHFLTLAANTVYTETCVTH